MDTNLSRRADRILNRRSLESLGRKDGLILWLPQKGSHLNFKTGGLSVGVNQNPIVGNDDFYGWRLGKLILYG